ncbi:hypothetical protein [Geothrix sp. 21YS21S-2]|uniref:hypothetical protein n=1 Tax=Geothrix sp. 21YS21S-2 TaxID=3068893 RepID=UPI0027B8BF19|nr:hypothetical protein [Geothrix sp. 21YS21S-2]
MTRPFKITLPLLSALGLGVILACGGGGGGSSAPAPPAKTIADTLTYTNPASGAYMLVRNGSKSTPSHLVLDLLGPSGEVSGVGFYLTADETKVTWTLVDPEDPERVKSGIFSNTIVKSLVSGGTLQAGVYQKGTTPAASVLASTVLASVALDLKSKVPLLNPPNVTLTSGKAIILNAPANAIATTPISITTGTLIAN